MITNNGKALMFVSDWHENNSNDPTYTLQRTNGTVADIKRNTTALTKKLGYNSLVQNIGIIVGTGTTAATPMDYTLENEITSVNLKISYHRCENAENCNCSYEAPFILQATATFYNNSLTDTITIKEIGLITKDDTGASYLLMREVLNSNDYIELAPNESTTLTVVVD